MLKLVICVVQFPKVTQLQIALFRHFSKQSIEFVILDDSKTEDDQRAFRKLSEDTGSEYFVYPHSKGGNNPSWRHAIGIRHALTSMKQSATHYGVVDSDMLPITHLDFDELFAATNLIMCSQIRGPVRYPWPGLCFWHTDVGLQHASWDPITYETYNTDSGGATFHHLQTVQDKLFEQPISTCDTKTNERLVFDVLQKSPEAYSFATFTKELSQQYERPFWIDVFTVKDCIFLHLRDISNWQQADQKFVREKIEFAVQRLKSLL